MASMNSNLQDIGVSHRRWSMADVEDENNFYWTLLCFSQWNTNWKKNTREKAFSLVKGNFFTLIFTSTWKPSWKRVHNLEKWLDPGTFAEF